MSYVSPVEDMRIDLGALMGAIVRKIPRIALVTLGLLVITFVVLTLAKLLILRAEKAKGI